MGRGRTSIGELNTDISARDACFCMAKIEALPGGEGAGEKQKVAVLVGGGGGGGGGGGRCGISDLPP